MTLSVGVKAAAGLAYRAHPHDAAAQVAAFRTLLTDANLTVPTNPHQFVATWGPRMDDDGNIARPAAHSGRPPKLTGEQVDTCYAQCLNWFEAGRPGPYHSVEELIRTNPAVRNIVEHTGVSGETLTRCFKSKDRHFQYGKVRSRPYLDQAHKDERVRQSQEKLQSLPQVKQWVVWVDEKVMCFSNSSAVGWFSSIAEDYAWQLPRLTHQRQTMKLKYIIGVNYLMGPCWIKFFTGTSGMPADRDSFAYRVSSALEQLGLLLSSNMLHCLQHSC